MANTSSPLPRTTVVNKRDSAFDVYIGRPSKWGNPFKVEQYGRDECIRRYEQYIRSRPDLMAAIKPELKGRVLGCFCKPLACHGDVLARIADEDDTQSYSSQRKDPLHSHWNDNIGRWSGVSEPSAIKQYKLDKRLIRLQERNRELAARKRRVPYSDGSRFLVTDHNQTAVYQSDDAISVLEYVRDHPGVQVYDLDKETDRYQAREIGKYMAPRDRERAIVPKFNPDEGKAGRFGSPRETLLKERKSVQVIPPSRDVTPQRVKLLSLVRHLRFGTPLIGKHNYTCTKCGYEATSCPCSLPARREREAEAPKIRQVTSDLVSKKHTLTTAEFIAKIRREAGLKELV